MTMYNQMSTDEIMHDVYNTFTHGMPSVLSDIADQYVNHRLPRYHIESQNIDIYAAQALITMTREESVNSSVWETTHLCGIITSMLYTATLAVLIFRAKDFIRFNT